MAIPPFFGYCRKSNTWVREGTKAVIRWWLQLVEKVTFLLAILVSKELSEVMTSTRLVRNT